MNFKNKNYPSYAQCKDLQRIAILLRQQSIIPIILKK